MRINGCLITSKGITCLNKNSINDYAIGYITIRFLELIIRDIIIKYNNENIDNILNNIDFT